MGYKDNPFGSESGNKIVQKIFDLMFIPEEDDVAKIEHENLQREVLFYRNNIINIVNQNEKIRRGLSIRAYFGIRFFRNSCLPSLSSERFHLSLGSSGCGSLQ